MWDLRDGCIQVFLFLGRFYPILRWLFVALLLPPVVSIAASLLFASPRPEFLDAMAPRFWPLIVVSFVLGALTLAARAGAREEQRRRKFALFKPASRLRPRDFGFAPVGPGQTRWEPTLRPFHDTYIPRRMSPYDGGAGSEYDEEWAFGHLQRGESLLILGPPLDGKSRTVFHLACRLHGFTAVRPTRDQACPPEDAFAVLKDRPVLVILEDLNEYISADLDLGTFLGRVREATGERPVAIVSTCRDGPELGAVSEALGTSLRRVYEDMSWKVRLLPLREKETAQLARAIGQDASSAPELAPPTPGWVTMREPMRYMRERFRDLDPSGKDILRALRLLASAGVLPFTHGRLVAVLEEVLDRRGLHLGDALVTLADQAFIRCPARQDPVEPEPAYLLYCVDYGDGKDPTDDFPALANVLDKTVDAEGLFYLGVHFGLNTRDNDQALRLFEHALRLRSDLAEAWNDKGIILGKLGRPEEALAAYDQALRTRPDFPEAWYNQALALNRLDRSAEALAAYDEALRLRPDFSEAWSNRGVTLGRLGRPAEALAAFDEALRLCPDSSEAWSSKGNALNQLDRPAEALAAYDEALRLRPDFPEAWNNKGVVLNQLDRPAEALAAYDEALRLRPDDPEAWYNKGVALRELGRHPEAIAALCAAWRRRDRLPDKGANAEEILRQLGQDPTECDEIPPPSGP